MPLKKKKFIQRLQHIVRFDIGFEAKNDQRDTSKPIINFVQAGSVSCQAGRLSQDTSRGLHSGKNLLIETLQVIGRMVALTACF